MPFSVYLTVCGRFINYRTLCLVRKEVEYDMLASVTLSQRFISSDVKSSNSSSSSTSSSDDSSSSDEEDNGRPQYSSYGDIAKKQSVNNKKLNTLLQSMVKQQEANMLKKVDISKTEEIVTSRIEITRDSQEQHHISKDISDIKTAAKTVAESLGGDIRKTESELLNRLICHGLEKGSQKKISKKKTVSLSELIAGMQIDRNPSSTKAYQNIQRIIGENTKSSPQPGIAGRRGEFRESISDSERLGGAAAKDHKFQSKRERSSDMRTISRKREVADLSSKDSSISSSLFSEGKISPQSRPHQVSSSYQKRIPPQKIEIFGGEPLGIFAPSTEHTRTPPLRTWLKLCERDLALAVVHPPANYFEEMILWTEKEMLWKFPINNEQGLEEENRVRFTEHVFLEKHLAPWCPTKGPIRHFMELVCIGLSKNPYYIVEEKKNHILWFKQYFEEKTDVLKSVGISLNFQEQTKLSE